MNCASSTAWECARSIFSGVLSIITSLLCGFALFRVVKTHRFRKSFQLNIIMLFLTFMQTLIDSIELLGKRESRLQLTSITIRCCQTILVCSAYATFIVEKRGQFDKFRKVIVASSVISGIFVFVTFVLAWLQINDLTCEHPLWLLIGAFQFVLSIVFFLVGILATREMNDLLKAYTNSASLTSEYAHYRKSQRELWILIVFFLIASSSQVAGDAWRQVLYQNGGFCEGHETHVEEFFRSVLFVLSFDFPAWGTLIVFYYLPRFNFDPSFDIELPDVQLLEQCDSEELFGDYQTSELDIQYNIQAAQLLSNQSRQPCKNEI